MRNIGSAINFHSLFHKTPVLNIDRYGMRKFVRKYGKGLHSLVPDSHLNFLCRENSTNSECAQDATVINDGNIKNEWLDTLNNSSNLGNILGMQDRIAIYGSDITFTARYIKTTEGSSLVYEDGEPIKWKWIRQLDDGTVLSESLPIEGISQPITTNSNSDKEHSFLVGYYSGINRDFLPDNRITDNALYPFPLNSHNC